MAFHVLQRDQETTKQKIMVALRANPTQWFRCEALAKSMFGDPNESYRWTNTEERRRLTRYVDRLLGDLVSRDKLATMKFERDVWLYAAGPASNNASPKSWRSFPEGFESTPNGV